MSLDILACMVCGITGLLILAWLIDMNRGLSLKRGLLRSL